jgi:hypothetical protein
MKLVVLREQPGLKSVEIIRTVIERPANGASVSELRARCRVLDALDKALSGAASLTLEDADHATLAKAVNGFQFGIATKELLTIVDDILEANELPAGPPPAA